MGESKKRAYFIYNSNIDGTDFKLYIPQERFSTETGYDPPGMILVGILSISDYDALSGQRQDNTIISKIRFFEEKTVTVRYDCVEYENNMRIGNPYIPKSILDEPYAGELGIRVKW